MSDYTQVPLIDDEQFSLVAQADEDDPAKMMRELVDLFEEESRPRMDKMAAAIETGDIETVKRQAHALAGSGGNLGAKRFSDMCRALEKEAAGMDKNLARQSVKNIVETFAGTISAFRDKIETLDG